MEWMDRSYHQLISSQPRPRGLIIPREKEMSESLWPSRFSDATGDDSRDEMEGRHIFAGCTYTKREEGERGSGVMEKVRFMFHRCSGYGEARESERSYCEAGPRPL